MAKDERKHLVQPLAYEEIPLPDGRVLVLKQRLEVPLERRDIRSPWYASLEELGLQAEDYDQQMVDLEITEQIGELYLTGVESPAPKTREQRERAMKLKAMVKEIRN